MSLMLCMSRFNRFLTKTRIYCPSVFLSGSSSVKKIHSAIEKALGSEDEAEEDEAEEDEAKEDEVATSTHEVLRVVFLSFEPSC